MLHFFHGARKARDVLMEGLFDCKDCGPGQPCRLVKVSRRNYAYFIIPMETGDELDRYLECGKCHRRYSPESFRPVETPGGSSSSQVFEAVTWSCPNCHRKNPNDRYRCAACAYSLI
jgi:hypothetical protein